jgi:LysM repeat protein
MWCRERATPILLGRRGPGRRRHGYHRRVTDRTPEAQVVCPFVAYDDDRDFRAPVPDHRHRCFAETPAAPRALAHQAAYCLSTSFPACPTFADWARREAAPVRPDAPVRTLRDAGGAPRAATAPLAGAGPEPAATPRPGGESWTAPPPWAAGVAGAAGAAAISGTAGDAAPAEDAGEIASQGSVSPGRSPRDELSGGPLAADATPAFLAGRAARPPAEPPTPQPPAEPAADPWARPPDDRAAAGAAPVSDRYAEPAPPIAEPRRAPVGYAAVPPGRADRRPVAGAPASGREHRDASAPSWEEPRRHEAYPTLKSRGSGGIPRPLGFALVILFAGVALFAAPFVLRGIGGGGEEAAPTPTPAASVDPTPTPLPTPEPSPEEVVYIVKKGDTLSKIANRFGVTVDDILAANPTIKNANQIAIGDELVIPPPEPDEVVDDGTITPAP